MFSVSVEDFDFYDDVDENVDDIKGLTDEVTEFTYTDLSYPCLVFCEGFQLASHKWRVLSNMVKSEAPDKDISLYFMENGDMLRIGSISGRQVDAVLDLIDTANVVGYMSEGVELRGDLLYTLEVIA